jgi:hypothetical protein
MERPPVEAESKEPEARFGSKPRPHGEVAKDQRQHGDCEADPAAGGKQEPQQPADGEREAGDGPPVRDRLVRVIAAGARAEGGAR